MIIPSVILSNVIPEIRERSKQNNHLNEIVKNRIKETNNFEDDENISKKIVNSFSLKEFDKIVEIGPGKGALTKYLFEFSDK